MNNTDHTDFSDRLWYDNSIFENRYQKSASALIAINNIINQRRPLNNEQENVFLQQYDCLKKQPAEIFSAIWMDPSCYWWTRTTYHLLASTLNQIPLSQQAEAYIQQTGVESIEQALASILLQFNRFALASMILSEQPGFFDIPLTVDLPFSIPGTELILFGTGKCDIFGFEPGSILLQDQKINISECDSYTQYADHTIRIILAPQAKHLDCVLMLNPYIYNNLPGLTFTSSVEGINLDYQKDCAGLVESALAVLSRFHPEVYRQFTDNVYSIALKPLSNGGFTNMAYSDLPGTFIISFKNNAYELADIFIHEFHHNRLFFFEEQGGFFSQQGGPDALSDASFYSPWRDDLRPLHGIFHAAYVYTPVNEFWLSVLKHSDTTHNQGLKNYAIDCVLRGVMQVHLGLYILMQHGDLTELGEAILEQIQDSLNAITKEIKALDLSYATPSTICTENGELLSETNAIDPQALTLEEALLSHIESVAPAEQVQPLQHQFRSFKETFTLYQ